MEIREKRINKKENSLFAQLFKFCFKDMIGLWEVL